MTEIAVLPEATDVRRFGPKAVQLGAAIRAGLPVPPGLALSCTAVSALADGDDEHVARLAALLGASAERTRWAVRSSAVGEDSAEASFAGIHQSVLGVCRLPGLLSALREVRRSAFDAGAMAYRDQLGIAAPPAMAVVLQHLVEADVAGVMFTRNPVTGADERVVEASWGLGESVVAGLVTPDRYVLDRSGRLTQWRPGEKDLAVRHHPAGGTREEAVTGPFVTAACLGTDELAALQALALACDAAFGGTAHDIEFAFAGGVLYLLQRRAITGG